ncbi:class I SAM-dependent methyltransferase [Ferrovum sp.]|uniref:class I SAM-dependent methyltransferase n=1 Tax=Ferrovum sp. TaxID=2609467 RepID=UPI00261B3E58|nr:class I SAM-dependent methyltransferase [Ferrovum sp.]
MSKGFRDHFSSVSSDYVKNRPTYPLDLFEWLAGQCMSRDLAWDCGTGNGQAATGLARYFDRVLATDASTSQIAQAIHHPKIEYRVSPAESCCLDNRSADLVVIAQALHWFDLDHFYTEVTRGLKPGGLVAAWSYGVLMVEGEEVNAMVQRFYHNELGPYWPPERRHVETGYRDLAFPFTRIPAPSFAMSASWTLEQLLGYFRSWSATAYFIEDKGFDPVSNLELHLRDYWKDVDQRRAIEWPLAILVGSTTR